MTNKDTLNILALDSSTENCSVALLANGKIYARREVAPRDHTKLILPMVDAVLKEAQVTLKSLDALAFGQGPGGFTGVRIGIGIAQGLAFGANLPMIGVSTLEAMAQRAFRQSGDTRIATAIDARMSEVYWSRYERQNEQWVAVDAETVIAPGKLVERATANESTQHNDDAAWLQVGTGWAAYEEALTQLPYSTKSSDILFPDAEDMLDIAVRSFLAGNTVDVEESEPVYLRDTVTWKKLPGKE
ncbi:tRNA (adenosine(37)-N6)-threonylcarbamoyltransferase complex dimerization subunit type 1 TsaB [Vibrio sp.]|nr:tRNA (adenosine(37)-N6)-threonylcarbamoyltransferase complex dimerization subunit type 1 TsaB [Vibrio sp.]